MGETIEVPDREGEASISARGRTIFGAVVGIIAGLAVGLLTVYDLPPAGLETVRGHVSRLEIVVGYLAAGVVVGSTAGYLTPWISSASRAGALGAALGAPLFLVGVFRAAPDLIETAYDYVWLAAHGALTGGGVGALFYFVDSRITYPGDP